MILVFTGINMRAADESLCAVVKIEIQQELTLERQAFDAHMRINNGLPSSPLTSVDIDVIFEDADGNTVLATSDPSNTNALFYIRVDRMEGIADVDGNGNVLASTSADIHWLIIPSHGAGGESPAGLRYFVGATLSYDLDGDHHEMDVTPDSIFVKPMPSLVLDYFLPEDVYGDDAFTQLIEPPVPFSLGVRVGNDGPGNAVDLKIESSQPKVIENNLGLLIGFSITGSEVNGQDGTDSLLVDFGDVNADTAGIASWTMECTLSGEFTEFTASFTHSDELGGELTSLIDEVNTHFLLKRVLCYSNGRDSIHDFLALDGEVITAYESDYIDTSVTDRSSGATLSTQSASGISTTYTLTTPANDGPLYVSLDSDDSDNKDILSVQRDDGTPVPLDNVWFQKDRPNGNSPWEHHLRLFDMEGGYTYTILVEDISATPQPPVIQYIGDKVTFVGDPLGLGFMVEATDINGTVPLLSASELPSGAEFTITTNGVIAEGDFFWRPQAYQTGVYPMRFVASDGTYTDEETIRIYVGAEDESVDENDIPVSLSDWDPVVTNITATSDSGTAVVHWVTSSGILYDIYRSYDEYSVSNMTWTLVASNILAQGHTETWSDTELGTERDLAYYKVLLSGDPTNERRVWGVMRMELADGAYSLVAPPLRGSRMLSGTFGTALTEAWLGDDQGPGGEGTELYLLNSDGSWQVLYLDSAGSWRNGDGTLATAELAAGHAAMARGAGGGTATFTGQAGTEDATQVVINAGWNLLSPGDGRVLHLSKFIAETSGTPIGGVPATPKDQVVYWDNEGTQHRLILIDGWGASWDGNWVDSVSQEITDPELQSGEVIYYYSVQVAEE